MAHDGEKAALRRVGAFGFGAGIDQRFLLGLACADVAQHRDDLASIVSGARNAIQRAAAHLDPGKLHRHAFGLAQAELDAAGVPARRRIGEGCQVGWPVGDMDTIEQPMADEIVRNCPEHRRGVGRREEHAAVLSVPGDDVGHIAGQQPAPFFLESEEMRIRPRDRIGTERDAGCIECCGNDAEGRERA